MTSVPYAEVIGDPISHSKSPLIHNYWLGRVGMEGEYRAVQVGKDDLPRYLDDRRRDPLWRGCNLTMPLKEVAAAHLDSVHRAAIEIGAVNVISRTADGRLLGRNSDVEGIWRALDGVPLAGKRALLLGSGGAARAATYALRRSEVDTLHIVARSRAAGENVARVLFPQASVGDWSELPPADLLVNATPLGMTGTEWPPLSLERLAPDATVFDMVYAPPLTPLLAAARTRGLRTVGGAAMLLHQAAVGFRLFFGASAPRQSFAELTELLTP